MGGSDAARLFLDRAVLHPGFALTDAAAPALAQLCHRLDGIPLAIELAAARTRTLSVEQIHDRLDQRFRLLTGGSRTALPRQQTLQGLMDWSYELLTAGERRLLAHLSVFSGGWTLAAAESVCAGEGVEGWEVLDGLTGLVDKSLAAFDSRRYRLLETVRLYARERLEETPDADAARECHANFFLALAAETEPKLCMGRTPACSSTNWKRSTTTSAPASPGSARGGRLTGRCAWQTTWRASGRCAAI